MSLRFTTLHYTTLHFTTLHCTPLHYITQHHDYNYTPLHSTTLHYTRLHYATLHYTTLHYTTLHSTTLHYLPVHFTTLHYTTLHYTTTTTTTTTTQLHSTTSGPNPQCFVHFDLEMCFAPQRRALFRHLNFQKWSERGVFCTFWLRNVLRATTACTFSTSQLPKVVRPLCVLYILTWKCASRHNGVHFFVISTSKSGPNVVCFVHFDFEMCFAPQPRALFRHLSFQKWSDNGVFCAFWLGNVLRTTTACTFSTSQLPKVVRAWCALYILTSKCASRRSGVHFFDISTSKSGPIVVFCKFLLGNVLRATTACNFSSLIWPAGSAPAALARLLFDPPEPQIIGRIQCFTTFLPFHASASFFFWLFLFYSSFF